MLDRLLKHLQYAVALRECAAKRPHAPERLMFTAIASLHEGRAHKLMRQVQRENARKAAGKAVSLRGREGGKPFENSISDPARHTPLGRPQSSIFSLKR